MRLRDAARVLAVNVLVVLLLVAALEAFVRVLRPQITPLGTDKRLVADSVFGASSAPRAGAVGKSNGALHRVNDLGFWDYGVPIDSAKGSWLLLGDSATMGIGVDPDSTFAGRIARSFDAVNILNLSLVGYSQRDYRRIIEALIAKPGYEDHLPSELKRVTVVWCLNDIYSAFPSFRDPDQTVRRTGGAVLRLARRHFRAYQFLKALLFDRPRSYFEHDLQLYLQADTSRSDTFGDLERIYLLCRERGINFEVVILPFEYQLRDPVTATKLLPQRVMERKLADSGIVFHDILEFFRAYRGGPSELFLYGDGIHLSTVGHRLVADFLLNRVTEPR